MVEQFRVGQRVRLKKKLATEIEGEIAIWVRMDRHFPQLARWDNAVLVKCSSITD